MALWWRFTGGLCIAAIVVGYVVARRLSALVRLGRFVNARRSLEFDTALIRDGIRPVNQRNSVGSLSCSTRSTLSDKNPAAARSARVSSGS
jgi:hypothetical protein